MKLNIGVSQSDNSQMFELLESIYPMTIHKYEAGTEHNGWVVPHDWIVHKALIKKDGKVMFDGLVNPLAVAGYSPSFHGTISKKELDEHVFTRPELPDAYTFHSMNNYRPWAKFWGFCIPHNLYSQFTEGEYEIELETEYKEGVMLVGEAEHKGESEKTIIFNAHTCHPLQFNDDLAGVSVILELFEWLKGQNTKYTYKGILAPEHLGTVFYLAGLSDESLSDLKLGTFVEMVGIDEQLVLQGSFSGKALIDRVATHVLKQHVPDLKVGPYRTVVGNDESVWEAPGIEVPFTSISRCYHKSYYPQYHTSEDTMEINLPENLSQTLEVLKEMIYVFENDCTMERKFKGIISLSNPKYNLYIERLDPTVDKKLSEADLKMGELQDYLPRYFNGEYTLFEIAEKFDIPFRGLLAYIKKFEDKELIKLQAIDALEHYKETSQRSSPDIKAP